MINKLFLAGALFAVTGAQAVTLTVSYNNEIKRCVLSEINQGRAEFENSGVAVDINAQPQEDGSVIATLILQVNGEDHAAPTIVIPANDAVILACQTPASTDVLTVAVEPAQEVETTPAIVTNEVA